MKQKILVFLITIILGLGFVAIKEVKAGPDENVYGWAWSNNIGWISFNSTNCDPGSDRPSNTNTLECGAQGSSYGVHIDPTTGLFSGYAWGENIGWISFGDFDADGDIDSDDKNIFGSPCAVSGPNCEATLNLSTNKVSGWARALAPVGVKYEHSDDDLVGILSGTQFYLNKDIIYGSFTKYAQIFTTVAGHSVNYISLMLLRAGSPGYVIVSIQRVSLDAPNGDIICQATIDGNSLLLVRPGGPYIGDRGPSFWTDIFLGDCNLQGPGYKYAIVVNAPNGSYNKDVHWFFDDTAGYLDGSRVYEEDGEWITENDYLFQIWKGDPLIESARTDPPGWISGGWDGWIKLRGTWTNGVWLDTSISPYEFRGWAWGSDVIAWVSFNCKNREVATGKTCLDGNDPAFDPTINLVDYKVLTGIEINDPPTAAISCDPSCEVYETEILQLINESTDPNGEGDIFKSIWYINDIEKTSCAGKCNFTPQNWVNIGSYTAKLYVEDTVNQSDTATRDFRIKRDITAGFMCSLDNAVWQVCDDPLTFSPVGGNTVYFKDDSSLSEYSRASEGAAINSRVWEKDEDPPFDSGNNTNPSLTATIPSMTIKLTVTDSVGRTTSKTHIIGVRMRLPTWKEIPPF